MRARALGSCPAGGRAHRIRWRRLPCSQEESAGCAAWCGSELSLCTAKQCRRPRAMCARACVSLSVSRACCAAGMLWRQGVGGDARQRSIGLHAQMLRSQLPRALLCCVRCVPRTAHHACAAVCLSCVNERPVHTREWKASLMTTLALPFCIQTVLALRDCLWRAAAAAALSGRRGRQDKKPAIAASVCACMAASGRGSVKPTQGPLPALLCGAGRWVGGAVHFSLHSRVLSRRGSLVRPVALRRPAVRSADTCAPGPSLVSAS